MERLMIVCFKSKVFINFVFRFSIVFITIMNHIRLVMCYVVTFEIWFTNSMP